MPIQPLKECGDLDATATLSGRQSHIRVNLFIIQNVALRVLEWVNLSIKTSLSQCRWGCNGFQAEASSFTMDRCQRKR